MSESSGSMMSSVGNRQVYEDGDQRVHGHAAGPAAGGKHSERKVDLDDSRSELTMQNRQKHDRQKAREAERAAAGETVKEPLAPATWQGHEPSRGAQVDAELKAEDEAALAKKVRQKGQFGPKVNDVE